MRTRSRRLVGALVILGLASACEAIVGIDDHAFKLPPAPPDPCFHARPPVRPNVPDTPGPDPNQQYVFAVNHLALDTRDDAGNAIGFDLDGVCTCETRSPTAFDGGSSCIPAGGQASGVCDFDGGVDNALVGALDTFTQLLPAQSDIEHGLNDPIRCGETTALIVLRQYNGQANDPSVVVSAVVGNGIRTGGDARPLDPSCTNSSDQNPRLPALEDGTDVWDVDPGTYVHNTDPPVPQVGLTGWVSDYQLVIDGVDRDTLPFIIGSRFIILGRPTMVAKLTPWNGTFKLEGTIAGRALTSDLLAAVGAVRIQSGIASGGRGYLCKTSFFPIVKSFICSASDSVVYPFRDFQGDACDSLSVASTFTAVPAKLGGEVQLLGNLDDCDPPSCL